MKTIDVYADTEGFALCNGPTCGQRILWAEVVASGKRMCFTAQAAPPRIVNWHRDDNGRAIHTYDLADNHWGPCPDAKGFRK
jgi:hypothetical protein